MVSAKPIRVLVVDDSAFYRTLIAGILAESPMFEVVGTAEDPFNAREKIKQFNPDVITLDVEMPGMSGIDFLEKIMTLRPMPVVMVSTLTGKGTETAIEALHIGAVECIAKPAEDTQRYLDAFARELRHKVQVAATAKLRVSPSASIAAKPQLIARGGVLRSTAPKIIAIGSSTGGVEALAEVLTRLPRECPPILITQHIPPLFTASFAKRLSNLCMLEVCEASHRLPLKYGMACIAPGGKHLEVRHDGKALMCAITDSEPVNLHKPSVDVLFDSVADVLGAQALGVILTGMGKDGAAGLLRMREAGAHTVGQDEASCVVYGMPQAAANIGAVAEVCPLGTVHAAITRRCFG